MARLTEAEEIELLALLEQQNRERVSPRLEAFRDPILGGECKPEIRIRGCRGGRGAGAKCLKIGTKIWMYDGTLKPVEEIKAGDKVMGSDSKPRNVLSTTKGNGQLYKIKQEHAIDYIVNDSHILTLKKASWCKKDKGAFMTYGYRRPNGSYPSWDDIVDINIQDYLGMSERWKSAFNGFKAGCLQYKEQEVVIDPYILGAWLGDGSSNRFEITTMDTEILQAFRDYCTPLGLKENISIKRNGDNKAKGYYYTGGSGKTQIRNVAIDRLRYYDLFNNKHIPVEYMVNSESNRLQLLAGLIDTDGTLRGNKSGYSFCQKSLELSSQVKQLADSLGFKTSIIKNYTSCNGKMFESYKVNISGDIWRIPCRTKRKKIKEEDYVRKSNALVTYIKVEDAGFGDWAGFETDGDHRFLLEDGTVTHNSHSLVSLIVQRANYQKIRVGCFREIQDSLEESVYALIKIKVEQLGYGGWVFQKGVIYSPCGSKFIFKGLKDLRAAGQVKGLEAFDIYFIEEAAPITMESWDLLMPTLMRHPGSQLWFAYNPETEFDPVTVKIWNRNRSDALLIELRPGPIDNPWWNDGLQKEMEEDFKADPVEAEHIWNGLPRRQGQRSVMAQADIREAMNRTIEAVGIIQVGCDVARFGDDFTVLYKRKGLKVIDRKRFSKQDTMATAYECWDMAGRDPNVPIVVDDTGVGGGVSDRLRELGAKVIAVNFGGSPSDSDKYTSIADELWFNFPVAEVDIPDDNELMQQLSSRQYTYDNKGRRKIESKQTYKDRCGHSPDDADSLLLCFFSGAGTAFPDDIRDAMRQRRVI